GLGGQRGGLGLGETVNADDLVLAGLDPPTPCGMSLDELLLHVPALYCGDCTAECLDSIHLGHGTGSDPGDLCLDDGRSLEQVVVLEQVRLVSEHLLDPQAPLLIPRARTTQCFVPRRELHRPPPPPAPPPLAAPPPPARRTRRRPPRLCAPRGGRPAPRPGFFGEPDRQ